MAEATEEAAETETETEVSGEKVTESESMTGESEAAGKSEDIWIDSEHVYEGMKTSFSKGYVPVITEQSLKVVIPFLSDARLRDDIITVEADVSDAVSCGVTARSYIKKVRKSSCGIENGEKKEVYLYSCTFALNKQREGGIGKILLKVSADGEKGQKLAFSYTVFADLEKSVKRDNRNDKNEEGGADEKNAGSCEKSEEADEEITGAAMENTGTESTQSVVHQPGLIMESCKCSEERPEAGQSCIFEAVFRNCSKNRTIQNLKAVCTASDENILISKASSYVESVSAGACFTIKKEIQTAVTMEQGNYLIKVDFEYDDMDGGTFTASESIPLTLTQPLSVELDKMIIPENVYSTDTITSSISVINSGHAPVYNVTVTMDCDGLEPVRSVFLGNMEAGTQSQGEMQIYVSSLSGEESYGFIGGCVKMTYQDAYGKVYEQKQNISTTIQKPDILELQVEEAKTQTNGWTGMITALIFLIMSGSIIWLVVLLCRKNRMQN